MKKIFFMLFFLISAVTAQVSESDVDKAVINTSKGEIEIVLFTNKAPKSVANFVKYAESDFYNDTLFHRVIPGFMIQAGGLTEDLERKKTNEPIVNEADNGLVNTRGTVAMARTAEPHSATSQFFINLVDNNFLNFKSKDSGQTWGYTVFGKVTKGMDVVDAISRAATEIQKGRRDVPVEPIKILSVEIIKKPIDVETIKSTKQKSENIKLKITENTTDTIESTSE